MMQCSCTLLYEHVVRADLACTSADDDLVREGEGRLELDGDLGQDGSDSPQQHAVLVPVLAKHEVGPLAPRRLSVAQVQGVVDVAVAVHLAPLR